MSGFLAADRHRAMLQICIGSTSEAVMQILSIFSFIQLKGCIELYLCASLIGGLFVDLLVVCQQIEHRSRARCGV